MKKGLISLLMALVLLATASASAASSSTQLPTKGYMYSVDGTPLYASSDGYDWYQDEAELISITPAQAPEGAPETTADGRTIFYYHFEYLITRYLGTSILNKPTIVFRVKMLAVEYPDNSSGYRFLENEGVSVDSYKNFDYVSSSVTVDRIDYYNYTQSFQIDVTVKARLPGESTTYAHSFMLEADMDDRE